VVNGADSRNARRKAIHSKNTRGALELFSFIHLQADRAGEVENLSTRRAVT
jgi:hypothetical protein